MESKAQMIFLVVWLHERYNIIRNRRGRTPLGNRSKESLKKMEKNPNPCQYNYTITIKCRNNFQSFFFFNHWIQGTMLYSFTQIESNLQGATGRI